jgi:N-methylhydantoinase A
MGGISEEEIELIFFVSARYVDQVYEIEIPLKNGHITQEHLSRIVEDFHQTHEKRYGYRDKTSYQEYTDWRVEARGMTKGVSLPIQSRHSATNPAAAEVGTQKAYFKEMGGFNEIPIYDGNNLRHGMVIEGPAMIVEATTTIMVIPGYLTSVMADGGYLMENID